MKQSKYTKQEYYGFETPYAKITTYGEEEYLRKFYRQNYAKFKKYRVKEEGFVRDIIDTRKIKHINTKAAIKKALASLTYVSNKDEYMRYNILKAMSAEDKKLLRKYLSIVEGTSFPKTRATLDNFSLDYVSGVGADPTLIHVSGKIRVTIVYGRNSTDPDWLEITKID